jgi:hypothetical protein
MFLVNVCGRFLKCQVVPTSPTPSINDTECIILADRGFGPRISERGNWPGLPAYYRTRLVMRGSGRVYKK